MNITLNVIDTCCSNCYKNTNERTMTFKDQSDTLNLQGNFTLNVLSTSPSHYTILIQNGSYIIIRNVLNNVQTSIIVPSNCSHIVTIQSIN